MHVFRKATAALLAGILGVSGGLRAADFLRGDVDGSGRLAVSDGIRILAHLFQGDAGAVPCADAADADDSGAIDVADTIHLLAGLFQGGPAPEAPFPACGEDPTEDALGCEEACPPASVYYGKEFRADGLFFVVDRSGSMNDSGKLTRAKMELGRLIEILPPGIEFGIVFFAADLIVFPSSGRPAESTAEMRASAAAFIRNVPGPAGRAACRLSWRPSISRGVPAPGARLSSMSARTRRHARAPRRNLISKSCSRPSRRKMRATPGSTRSRSLRGSDSRTITSSSLPSGTAERTRRCRDPLHLHRRVSSAGYRPRVSRLRSSSAATWMARGAGKRKVLGLNHRAPPRLHTSGRRRGLVGPLDR